MSEDYKKEIKRLWDKIYELEDENKKYRRVTEDALNNIDMDNLGASVKREIKAAGNNAEVAIIAEGLGKYDENGKLIGVSSAKIVAAVNGADSSVTIDADKIDLNGITNVAETLTLGSGNGGEIIFDSNASVSCDSSAHMSLAAHTFSLNASGGLTMSNTISDEYVNGADVSSFQNIVGVDKSGGDYEIAVRPMNYNGSHSLQFLVIKRNSQGSITDNYALDVSGTYFPTT